MEQYTSLLCKARTTLQGALSKSFQPPTSTSSVPLGHGLPQSSTSPASSPSPCFQLMADTRLHSHGDETELHASLQILSEDHPRALSKAKRMLQLEDAILSVLEDLMPAGSEDWDTAPTVYLQVMSAAAAAVLREADAHDSLLHWEEQATARVPSALAADNTPEAHAATAAFPSTRAVDNSAKPKTRMQASARQPVEVQTARLAKCAARKHGLAESCAEECMELMVTLQHSAAPPQETGLDIQYRLASLLVLEDAIHKESQAGELHEQCLQALKDAASYAAAAAAASSTSAASRALSSFGAPAATHAPTAAVSAKQEGTCFLGLKEAMSKSVAQALLLQCQAEKLEQESIYLETKFRGAHERPALGSTEHTHIEEDGSPRDDSEVGYKHAAIHAPAAGGTTAGGTVSKHSTGTVLSNLLNAQTATPKKPLRSSPTAEGDYPQLKGGYAQGGRSYPQQKGSYAESNGKYPRPRGNYVQHATTHVRFSLDEQDSPIKRSVKEAKSWPPEGSSPASTHSSSPPSERPSKLQNKLNGKAASPYTDLDSITTRRSSGDVIRESNPQPDLISKPREAAVRLSSSPDMGPHLPEAARYSGEERVGRSTMAHTSDTTAGVHSSASQDLGLPLPEAARYLGEERVGRSTSEQAHTSAKAAPLSVRSESEERVGRSTMAHTSERAAPLRVRSDSEESQADPGSPTAVDLLNALHMLGKHSSPVNDNSRRTSPASHAQPPHVHMDDHRTSSLSTLVPQPLRAGMDDPRASSLSTSRPKPLHELSGPSSTRSSPVSPTPPLSPPFPPSHSKLAQAHTPTRQPAFSSPSQSRFPSPSSLDSAKGRYLPPSTYLTSIDPAQDPARHQPHSVYRTSIDPTQETARQTAFSASLAPYLDSSDPEAEDAHNSLRHRGTRSTQEGMCSHAVPWFDFGAGLVTDATPSFGFPAQKREIRGLRNFDSSDIIDPLRRALQDRTSTHNYSSFRQPSPSGAANRATGAARGVSGGVADLQGSGAGVAVGMTGLHGGRVGGGVSGVQGWGAGVPGAMAGDHGWKAGVAGAGAPGGLRANTSTLSGGRGGGSAPLGNNAEKPSARHLLSHTLTVADMAKAQEAEQPSTRHSLPPSLTAAQVSMLLDLWHSALYSAQATAFLTHAMADLVAHQAAAAQDASVRASRQDNSSWLQREMTIPAAGEARPRAPPGADGAMARWRLRASQLEGGRKQILEEAQGLQRDVAMARSMVERLELLRMVKGDLSDQDNDKEKADAMYMRTAGGGTRSPIKQTRGRPCNQLAVMCGLAVGDGFDALKYAEKSVLGSRQAERMLALVAKLREQAVDHRQAHATSLKGEAASCKEEADTSALKAQKLYRRANMLEGQSSKTPTQESSDLRDSASALMDRAQKLELLGLEVTSRSQSMMSDAIEMESLARCLEQCAERISQASALELSAAQNQKEAVALMIESLVEAEGLQSQTGTRTTRPATVSASMAQRTFKVASHLRTQSLELAQTCQETFSSVAKQSSNKLILVAGFLGKLAAGLQSQFRTTAVQPSWAQPPAPPSNSIPDDVSGDGRDSKGHRAKARAALATATAAKAEANVLLDIADQLNQEVAHLKRVVGAALEASAFEALSHTREIALSAPNLPSFPIHGDGGGGYGGGIGGGGSVTAHVAAVPPLSLGSRPQASHPNPPRIGRDNLIEAPYSAHQLSSGQQEQVGKQVEAQRGQSLESKVLRLEKLVDAGRRAVLADCEISQLDPQALGSRNKRSRPL